MLYQLFLFFLIHSTVRSHQSTEMVLERAASHIKVTRPPFLFRLLPWENVKRSTALIYCTWVMSYQREITWFRRCCASYLKHRNYDSGKNTTSIGKWHLCGHVV